MATVSTQAAPIEHRPDEALISLAHEAAEHQRVWGLVSSLTSLVQSREQEIDILDGLLGQFRHQPQPTDEQNARIHHLEERIVKKEAIRHLEECRVFERETEQLLAAALQSVIDGGPLTKGAEVARKALATLAERKGPRSQEADAP